MNSIECKKYSKQKYKGNIRALVNKQIDKFFEIENSNYKLEQHNYKIGDNAILDKHNYLHGIGKNENAIDLLKNDYTKNEIDIASECEECYNKIKNFNDELKNRYKSENAKVLEELDYMWNNLSEVAQGR